MITKELVRHLIRFTLAWVLIAVTVIVIMLALVFWVLDLGELYEASERALLFLLPVAAHQLGMADSLKKRLQMT